MKLLIDANIVLDVLQDRKPHVDNSLLIWKLCEAGMAEGHILTLSFANLGYVMRKEMDFVKIENTFNTMARIFSFAELKQRDLGNAAVLHWEDFEDALQSVTAERIGADYIITRNVKDYEESCVKAITPEIFLTGFQM